MKNVLLLFLFIGSSVVSFAQSFDPPKDKMTPAEYANYMTDFYTINLSLNAEQKQQTYTTLLKQRTAQDSIRKNNIPIASDKLMDINNSLDDKYKEILSSRQYLNYLDLRSKRITRMKVKMADTNLSH